VCTRKLTARKQKGQTYKDGTTRSTYFCAKQRRGCGTVFIDRRQVDLELMALTVERLSDERHAEKVGALRSQVTEQLAAVRKEIQEVDALQEHISELLGLRKMSPTAFGIANEPLVRDLAALVAKRDALAEGVPDEPGVVESAESLEAEWIDGDVVKKRAMLSRAIGPGKVVVFPGPKTGKRVFDRTRIRPLDAEEFETLVKAAGAQQ
jgi:hypothetical protein